MAAKFIKIGEPAQDAERQALRFLQEGLPETYTVYGNPWLVERSGVIYELDAVVVAPHAIFVVEIKSYRGRIEGTDHDWYIPNPIPSPLKRNRLTAQILKGLLRRENYTAGQVWVEGLVFLSATTDVGVQGPASKDRVHTQKTILAALQDPALIERVSGRQSLPPASQADRDLLQLLTGFQKGSARPVRRVREYEIRGPLGHTDTYSELLGINGLTGKERVLRIYSIPHLGQQAQRARIEERARWEAQVLGRIGRIPGILSADQPFTDEAGIVLPMEHFAGVSLTTWIEKFVPNATPAQSQILPSLKSRTDLWMKIATALDESHRQGVVHRLLRPEVVLVQDWPDPQEIRITGFDLAKQLSTDATIASTSLGDDRLVFAAPEVVMAFSSAEPASDQFSLGALLALLLTGKPLFDHTRQLLTSHRMVRRVKDVSPRIPLSLDEVVDRMLKLRPTERYSSLKEAIQAVEDGRDPQQRTLPGFELPKTDGLDPDNLLSHTRLNPDYEVQGKLGQGGMAVVYSARHLPSGRTRALKISRAETAAEEALRGEYHVLSGLDHPNIVRVIDLTKMVEGRLTLIMERVGNQNLREWITEHTTPEPLAQRRLAEDLLAGLAYLEQKGVTHKDLKPDNLLVNDGRLTIIDFSLADFPEDTFCGGTALYRDPSSPRWTHATDRYAAALCLFELYAGRHAFDGKVPEPGERPQILAEEIDPSGLAAFFQKALDPNPEQRFGSAQAMRDALLRALGEDVQDAPQHATVHEAFELSTPLHATGLSPRAQNTLRRVRVLTVGDLVALEPSEIRAIHAIGTKTASEVLGLHGRLRAQGLKAEGDRSRPMEPPMMASLMDSPEPLAKLALPPSVRTTLEQAGLPSIGSLAGMTRSQLLEIRSVGPGTVAQLFEALQQFQTKQGDGQIRVTTLDRLWDQASSALTSSQKAALEGWIGLTGTPQTQQQLAAALGRSQPQISSDCNLGLEHLDQAVLDPAATALDSLLEGCGGIERLDELGRRFEGTWPADQITGQGMVRLLVKLSPGRFHILEIATLNSPVVAYPIYDLETLQRFAREVHRLAEPWPPLEPEAVRRSLSGFLPNYLGDPIDLGLRLDTDLRIAETGHLYYGPLPAAHALDFVLRQVRDCMSLEKLQHEVKRIFGSETPFPDRDHLISILTGLGCNVQGNEVVPAHRASLVAQPALDFDPPTVTFSADRTVEETIREMLREATQSRGFRMLVTPPERHAEIARSVATALGGTWVSFADAFFTDHQDRIPALERAERFVAQKATLKAAAESTFQRLLATQGRPGHTVVLGETGLLALCDALHLPRLLYDQTLSGNLGFWVLVIPGVIHQRQPRFNEGDAVWHLEGATLPLLNPLPS